MRAPTESLRRTSLFDRFLDRIEKAGNRLPDPVTLFLIFIGVVMIASAIAASLDVSAVHPGTGERIVALNLFSGEMIQRLLVELPKTFAGFPPLGLVLGVMIGIGVADKSGLIAAALKAFMGAIPNVLLTAALIFAGIMSSLAVDAGFVVVIPLGAVLFAGAGRHPLAGLAAAFAGVSAGFSANLLLTGLDPLLAGFTTPAAQLIDPSYEVEATANYYLMIALVPVFVLLGTWITERILEPRLGAWVPEDRDGAATAADAAKSLTGDERRGLRWAGVVLAATLVGIAFLVVPEGAPLRGPNGELAPFYRSIVALMLFTFLLPGLAYGIAVKKIRRDRDAVNMTAEAMSDLGLYIVLAFVAAHFIALFTWSNLGTIVAISGAQGLKAIGFTGLPLLVSFVLVSGTVNLLIGSASAKWAILAPIFVPMLMLLGVSPELTQGAYRIGDAFTNIVTPLMPYFPLVIVFGQKYQKDLGIGTLVGAMLPYSIAFGLASTGVLVGWVLLGLPLGPGAPLEYIN
ncbi:MAG: aminobenzoyl-glutamate transport protein [Planctomycetota bacterium]|jgi:aminobenzoyl-glutamate transport protein